MTQKNKRILDFDIETSLMKVYTHYIGNKVSIQPCQIAEESRIICISYKWSDEKKVKNLTWDKNHDDSDMLLEFNEIASKADVVCGHNAMNFDVKEIRSAIALRGLATAWCETPCFDTLREFRRVFRFKSNRLDAIAAQLGVGRKNPMSMQDWIDVSNDKRGALKKMVTYCDQDVKVLCKVRERLTPYVPPTARIANILNAEIRNIFPPCKECKGFTRMIKYGFYPYKGQRRQKYMCLSCYKVTKE